MEFKPTTLSARFHIEGDIEFVRADGTVCGSARLSGSIPLDDLTDPPQPPKEQDQHGPDHRE